MRFYLLASIVAATLLSATTVSARNYQLTCVMSDYNSANRVLDFKQLVPARATHVIDGSDSTIAESGMFGDADDAGSKIKLHYVGSLKGIGEVDVDYVFFKSTGVMIAKTRSKKSLNWDSEYPDRLAKYVINGACQLK